MAHIDLKKLTEVINAWESNLKDEILKMWHAAPVGNHRPQLADFAAQQAHHTLLEAINIAVNGNGSPSPIRPDQEDHDAIDREHGPLPPNPTMEQRADRYRLAQANKLIRQSAHVTS